MKVANATVTALYLFATCGTAEAAESSVDLMVYLDQTSVEVTSRGVIAVFARGGGLFFAETNSGVNSIQFPSVQFALDRETMGELSETCLIETDLSPVWHNCRAEISAELTFVKSEASLMVYEVNLIPHDR